jgi:RNA 2',3'-cyclic 3'-phosphodiesterase
VSHGPVDIRDTEMPRSATARLFLAIDPPVHVSEALAAWVRRALGPGRGKGSGASRPLRLLEPDLLHLTLCFLGARPVAEIEQLAAVLGDGAPAVGELSIGAPLWLPPRRPRVLAVEVHDPQGDLRRLHEAVSETLAGRFGWEPDGRHSGGEPSARSNARRGHSRTQRFRPHITLARMREDAAPRERELPPTPPLAFTPQEIVLYRSWLAPEGASYEALASATLIPV